jgi:hypothetical protein
MFTSFCFHFFMILCLSLAVVPKLMRQEVFRRLCSVDDYITNSTFVETMSVRELRVLDPHLARPLLDAMNNRPVGEDDWQIVEVPDNSFGPRRSSVRRPPPHARW